MQSTRPFEAQELDQAGGGDAVEAAYTRYTEALERAAAAQAHVAETGRALADSPWRGPALRAPLLSALDTLDERLGALGGATLAWVALGGSVDLVEPALPSIAAGAWAHAAPAEDRPVPSPSTPEAHLAAAALPTAPATAEPQSLPAAPPPRPASPRATAAQLDRLVTDRLGRRGADLAVSRAARRDRTQAVPDHNHVGSRTPNPEVALESLAAAVTSGAPVSEIEGGIRQCLRAGVSPADPRLIAKIAHLTQPLAGKDLKAVRKALRAARTRPCLEVVTEDSPVPADWPFWSKTRGRRVVIVGGDKRDAACDRLKAAFEMGEVQWDDAHARRRIHALATRIRRGSVDLVILVTGFLGHSVSDALVAACKDAGVPFVNVPRGYGVARVRKAIEEASVFAPYSLSSTSA